MELDYAMPAFLEAARSIFKAQVFPARYRALVARARTPALVIHGREDRLVPLASAIEASREHDEWRLEILDGLGHIPQMEAPHRWLSVVADWLERNADRSSGPPGRRRVRAARLIRPRPRTGLRT